MNKRAKLGVVSSGGEVIYQKKSLWRYRKLLLIGLSLATKFLIYLATVTFVAFGIRFVMAAHWQAATTAWMAATFFMFLLWTMEKWR